MKLGVFLLLILVVLKINSVEYRMNKQRNKHKLHKHQQFGNGNIIAAMGDAARQSPVDLEPWHYRIQMQPAPPSKQISQIDKEAYNQREDKENKQGCKKQQFQSENDDEAPQIKPKVYHKDPYAYYDPTEMLKMGQSYKDLFATPVVWERNIQNDNTKAIEAERKNSHYEAIYNQSKTYYNPELMTHEYELDKNANLLNHVFKPYEQTIVTKQTNQKYDDLKDDIWTRDVILNQLKIPHRQDIPIKQMRAVDMRLLDQKNRLIAEKLKNDSYYNSNRQRGPQIYKK